MGILALLEGFNYGLVLFYGLFLSVSIAGGTRNKKERLLVLLLCPVLILIQVLLLLLLGAGSVRKLYPLIVHLPLALILTFVLKKPAGVSFVSVFTAYLCCQLPRWGRIAVTALTRWPLAGEAVYAVSIVGLFFLLQRFFVKPAYDTMTYSRHSLYLFSSLPAGYYVFDYSTIIYSDLLYAGIPALNELVPTMLVLFYVVFLVAYHFENRQRTRAELQSAAQSVLVKQAEKEMEALRRTQMQTAIYRHDMRHHLNMIDAFLDTGKTEQALNYIRQVREEITSIPRERFCENEAVNLICSSFADKASRRGISLKVEARLPQTLAIADTELCAILSNGLENALNGASHPQVREKWVRLYCDVKGNKLLMEIKNPYGGTVTLEDGLPVTPDSGHGYGCRSIRAIVQQNQGLYTFEPKDGLFTLQIVLPLPPAN